MAEIELAKKTDLANKADKTYVDNQLANKVDKTYVDNQLASKADKTYVDEELNKKANQTYVNEQLSNKADAQNVYTKAEADNVFATKEELNNKADINDIPTDTSQLTNGAGFITGAYDNSNSGLSSTTLQEAIDELKALIDNLQNQD